MPERGWKVLTVREYTVDRIKKLAKERGLTVDQLLSELLSPKSGSGWVVCELCGAKVKLENPHSHREKVYPLAI